jgi:predicted DNA-binding transcriptional regulator AlpA
MNSNGSGRLLTPDQVAEMWQLPRSWIYERTRRRGAEQLPHIKLGKYLRFEEGAVREFLERQKVSVRNS